MGSKVITEPENFVRSKEQRERYRRCIRTIVNDLIIDLNGEISEYGDDFDYRDKLRDADWIKELRRMLVTGYLKQVQRTRIQSFSQEWAASA
jgi:hypothetical protein